MDRRDFLTSVGTGLGLLAASGLTRPAAMHAEGAAPASAPGESGAALEELRAALGELEASFRAGAWNLRSAQDAAEARRLVMFHLHHAIELWFEPSPERPAWKRFVTPEKKLLGDNPDAVYFATPVSADHRYRIWGNTAGATYTSFTVERGAAEGQNPTGLGATLNDSELEIAPDGTFELIASAAKPDEAGNWLRLDADAGSLTTRHYYERERSVAADPLHHIPLAIERLDVHEPPPPPSDASVAAGIRRVVSFLRTTVAPPRVDPAKLPPWVSIVPNRFPQPKRDDSNQGVGFAAKDNVYAMAPFALGPRSGARDPGPLPALSLRERGALESVHAHPRLPLSARLAEPRADEARARRELPDRARRAGPGRPELARHRGPPERLGLLALLAAGRRDRSARGESRRARRAVAQARRFARARSGFSSRYFQTCARGSATRASASRAGGAKSRALASHAARSAVVAAPKA